MGLKMFTLEIRVTILENTKLVFVSGPKKKKREKNLLKLVICWCESIVTDQRWESCESVESAILLSLQIFNHSKETTQRIRRSSTRGTHEGRRILLYPFCLAGWCESIVTIHVCWGWSLLVFFLFSYFFLNMHLFPFAPLFLWDLATYSIFIHILSLAPLQP